MDGENQGLQVLCMSIQDISEVAYIWVSRSYMKKGIFIFVGIVLTMSVAYAIVAHNRTKKVLYGGPNADN